MSISSGKQGVALRLDTLKNEIFLGKEPVKEYIFKKNYYFAAGDNVMNSGDSRYWGLVPEEFIVGVAVCVWKSPRVPCGLLIETEYHE